MCIKHNQSLAIEDIVHARQIASAKTGSIEENVIKCLLRDQTSQQVAQNEFKERKKEIGYDQYSKIRPDALKVAELLSKKYKLGIMANQPIHRTKQLEECGLIRYFHHSDMSDNYGFHKPDLRLFEEVFQETGANPTQSIMIDDNIERGLIPAKSLGMKTIWYKRENRSEANESIDIIIESLTELLDLL